MPPSRTSLISDRHSTTFASAAFPALIPQWSLADAFCTRYRCRGWRDGRLRIACDASSVVGIPVTVLLAHTSSLADRGHSGALRGAGRGRDRNFYVSVRKSGVGWDKTPTGVSQTVHGVVDSPANCPTLALPINAVQTGYVYQGRSGVHGCVFPDGENDV